MQLQGKRIVITGAAGGLGQHVAAAVVSAGGSSVLLDIQFPSGSEHAGEPVAVDLLDADAVQQVFAGIADFDAVLNLAGGFAMGAPAHDDADDWQRMFAINVTTLKNVLAAAVPRMRSRGGAIVNVGAYAALHGAANMSAYTAAKGVVMHITESLADEVRDQGIRVNAVLPTIIDTPANREAMPEADPGQWVAPQDLAAVICFLASDAARAVNGALVPVRGLS